MRRDKLLLNRLLVKVRDSKTRTISAPEEIPLRTSPVKYNAEEIQYHLWLCHEVGLLVGGEVVDGKFVTTGWLTWEGHDWLEASRARQASWFRDRKRRPPGFRP